MARTRQQKEESRKAIVRSAAKLFREKGFDRVTVADVMDGAGLTHGGFPRHFASKEDLVTAALSDLFESNAREPMMPATDLSGFLSAYLRSEHRDAAGTGCPFAALGPEMARAPVPTRRVLTEMIESQIAHFASQVPSDDPAARRRTAIGVWGAAIGTMMLARIVEDASLSDEILSASASIAKAIPQKSEAHSGEVA